MNVAERTLCVLLAFLPSEKVIEPGSFALLSTAAYRGLGKVPPTHCQ